MKIERIEKHHPDGFTYYVWKYDDPRHKPALVTTSSIIPGASDRYTEESEKFFVYNGRRYEVVGEEFVAGDMEPWFKDLRKRIISASEKLVGKYVFMVRCYGEDCGRASTVVFSPGRKLLWAGCDDMYYQLCNICEIDDNGLVTLTKEPARDFISSIKIHYMYDFEKIEEWINEEIY